MNDINKELCELLGICWHERKIPSLETQGWECACGKVFKTVSELESHSKTSNPDFISNPVALLREMSKRSDWRLFWKKYMDIQSRVGWDYAYKPLWFVENYILNKAGKLAITARDFLRGRRYERNDKLTIFLETCRKSDQICRKTRQDHYYKDCN